MNRPRPQPEWVHPPPGMETVPPDFEPGYIQVFDDAPTPGAGGELGPTHLVRIREPEYAYQLEFALEELAQDYPRAVRAVAPDGRTWTRRSGRFEKTSGPRPT